MFGQIGNFTILSPPLLRGCFFFLKRKTDGNSKKKRDFTSNALLGFAFSSIKMCTCNRERERERGNKYSAFLTMSRLFITNFSSLKTRKIAGNVFCDYCLIFFFFFSFFIIYFSVSMTFRLGGFE